MSEIVEVVATPQ